LGCRINPELENLGFAVWAAANSNGNVALVLGKDSAVLNTVPIKIAMNISGFGCSCATSDKEYYTGCEDGFHDG
jgi:hypothetical protein